MWGSDAQVELTSLNSASFYVLVACASLFLVSCSDTNFYLDDPGFASYTFLDHAVTCTEYHDINISTDYCVDGNTSVGFLINETNNNWSTICCVFDSGECYADDQENSTSGLAALCSYNASDPSEVFLTNTIYGWRALCQKGGIGFVDNWIDISNDSTICDDPEKLGIFSLSFNAGWNATCCVNELT